MIYAYVCVGFVYGQRDFWVFLPVRITQNHVFLPPILMQSVNDLENIKEDDLLNLVITSRPDSSDLGHSGVKPQEMTRH